MADKQSNAKNFDVLGTGAVAVDDFLYVEHFPQANEKIRVLLRDRQCGGQTGTALVTAARLDTRAGYIGALADDPLSRFVAECFERENVDLAHCIRRDYAPACHSTIIVDESTKSRTVLAYMAGQLGPDPLLPAEDVIGSTTVVLVDHHGLAGTLRIAEIARRMGAAVVGDIERIVPDVALNNGSAAGLADLLQLIDHLLVPARFAREWTGLDDAAAAAQWLWKQAAAVDMPHATVVVTAGDKGCWYVGGDSGIGEKRAAGVRYFPAFAVETVDTTGCGDVFHGAYCAALAEGMDLDARIRFASAAAALKATQPGGQAGIPTRRQLDQFLAEVTP